MPKVKAKLDWAKLKFELHLNVQIKLAAPFWLQLFHAFLTFDTKQKFFDEFLKYSQEKDLNGFKSCLLLSNFSALFDVSVTGF